MAATRNPRPTPAAPNLAHRVMAMANHFCGHFGLWQGCTAKPPCVWRPRLAWANMVERTPSLQRKAMLSRTPGCKGKPPRPWKRPRCGGPSPAAGKSVSVLRTTAPARSRCGPANSSLPPNDLLDDGRLRASGACGRLRHAEWFSQGLQLGIAPDWMPTCVGGRPARDHDAPHRGDARDLRPRPGRRRDDERVSRGETVLGSPPRSGAPSGGASRTLRPARRSSTSGPSRPPGDKAPSPGTARRTAWTRQPGARPVQR